MIRRCTPAKGFTVLSRTTVLADLAPFNRRVALRGGSAFCYAPNCVIALRIRHAQGTDARQIAEVHVASSKAAYQGLLPAEALERLTIPKREQAWKAILAEKKTITLVLEEERIVGFANLGATRDEDKEASATGEITSIYLLPAYWGRGHGERLCQSATVHLRRRGLQEVTLWVLEANWRARRFCVKIGFHFDGTLKTRQRDQHERREMRYAKRLGEMGV